MAWQWVVCTFIQDTDLSWTEAGHIRLDDGAPTHVGMEDLHHMADCPCSGKKPSIGHEMGRFSPPSNGKHLCRRIEIKMLHGLHMGIDGSSCNSKSVITIERWNWREWFVPPVVIPAALTIILVGFARDRWSR
jgi:hypothetical protein